MKFDAVILRVLGAPRTLLFVLIALLGGMTGTVSAIPG
jgi:hypothetical protein